MAYQKQFVRDFTNRSVSIITTSFDGNDRLAGASYLLQLCLSITLLTVSYRIRDSNLTKCKPDVRFNVFGNAHQRMGKSYRQSLTVAMKSLPHLINGITHWLGWVLMISNNRTLILCAPNVFRDTVCSHPRNTNHAFNTFKSYLQLLWRKRTDEVPYL